MDINDLHKFLNLAQTQNMQRSADELDISPSALSKSLRRLESSLNVQLFDRVGKFIKLNAHGQQLRPHAINLITQAKQTQAMFDRFNVERSYKIVGPSVLMFRWINEFSQNLLRSQPHVHLEFDTLYEQQALETVINGSADAAIVTSAVTQNLPDKMVVKGLGDLHMQIAAAASHPLVNHRVDDKVEVTVKDVLAHAFVGPKVSPYCGEERGLGCDGWQNHTMPRKLQFSVNDHSIMAQLIKSGQALGYVPDFWLKEFGLVQIQAKDCPYQCQEHMVLVGWQAQLLNALTS